MHKMLDEFQKWHNGVSLRDGHYFICGNKAYSTLPPRWEGTCYVGVIVPGIKPVKHPADLSHRHKRSTVLQSNWNELWGLVFPQAGIYMLWDQCRAFAKLVDSFVNFTTDSFQIINTELSAMREVVKQNRVVLDPILANTNGMCGMFGRECCVYIPDGRVPLARNIEHIQKAVAQ
ncbi:hypothetical protein JRQ81_017602 [Phrynocephalus forsythii]|uniref:Uncharacterized protein n=1 Tax=Phrynocephalus forsythii TaxID=171643 RepID=A0A9Q1B0H4_9SAUR|nr:hypothetical protein JRQ81_017602 [Phrynocephalus forsythii]